MSPLFHEKIWKGIGWISVTINYDGVELRGVLLNVTIPFYDVESIRVVEIPWWVSARGVTIGLPFRRRLYAVFGGHSAFKPGKGVLFEKDEGFWREVVVVVKDLEKFIESVERGSGRFIQK